MKKFRKDDLIGIRKARFASFVLLLVCFASMLVLSVLMAGSTAIYIAFAIVIAVLVVLWWILYRNILFEEAAFFEALTTDMRAVHRHLRILEATVRQIPDGVVILAENGDLVFVNETAKNLLAAFDDLDEVRYDEHAMDFSEKLKRSAILEAAEMGKAPEIVCVDGQYYKIGYVVIEQEKSRGRGAVAVISDVTENTKVENMQTEFVANVSHELKTPLTIIKGYTETLMSSAFDDADTIQKSLDIIVSEVDMMDRLIKDLIYLARVDFISADIKTSESDLPSLVRILIKKLSIAANKKSLSLNQMFADDLRIGIEMDRDCIEQVILNILGNAIKYTEEKGRVDVDIIPGQNCVQIVITDNGVGIPEEDLSRVFERFFRVDKARSEKSGGTGLGLAISKQIVDAHNGTINLESKYGRGTTVTVSLPAIKTRGTPGIL